MAANPTITISAVTGIDNRTDETKLKAGAVRDAVNVDITSDGVVQRRAGRRKVVATTMGHSLWSSNESPFALFCDGGALRALWSDHSATDVKTGLQPRDMYYTWLNGRVYCSNGVDSGCVQPDGYWTNWGVERPSLTFSLSATSTGGLDAGMYQVALVYQDRYREESGACESMYVDVPQGGGIAINNIPAPIDPYVVAVRVYVSPPNGATLFFAREVAVMAASTHLGVYTPGKPLQTQFMATLPPGKYLLKYNGRLLLASGKYLFFSEALRYGLYHENNGYLRFGEEITAILAPDAEGTCLYIGTKTKTYMYRGGTMGDGALSIVDHNGVVPGSGVTIPGHLLGIQGLVKPVPMWLNTNGSFFIGTEQRVIPIKQDTVATNVSDKASAIFMERDGLQQMLLSYYGGRQTRLAIGDRAIARVYDKSGV